MSKLTKHGKKGSDVYRRRTIRGFFPGKKEGVI
jgi:hypothetical protein